MHPNIKHKRSRIGLAAGAVVAALTTMGVAATPATASSTTSGNLFAGNQASFDTGTGGWVAGNASLSTVASPVQAGSGALAATTTGAAPANVWIYSGNGPSTWTPAVVGARYTGNLYVQGASVARSVTGFEAFYNSSGGVVGSTIWGATVTDTPGSWTAVDPVTAIAPAGAAYVIFGVQVYATSTGEVHYLDTASVTQTTVSPASVVGPLHTSGTQIVQANGAPITLRGLMRTHTQISASDFPPDAEIAQAKAWGANFVRVPLSESLWLNTCTRSHPSNVTSYPSSVDSEVSSITSRGMVALLDLHWNVTTRCGTPSQQAMADAQFAPSFWKQVASRYKSNPLVAFDLYNEPHDISDAVWLSGGTATYAGVTFQAAGMQQLYNTVHATGATNLVFMTGNVWGNFPAATLATGTNIVNAIHDYTCPGTPCTATNPYDPWPILSHWLQVAQTHPVMITETGYPSATTGIYFNYAVIQDAESQGWGWSIFAWDGTTSGEFDLLSSNGATYEPAPAGMAVVVGLERN